MGAALPGFGPPVAGSMAVMQRDQLADFLRRRREAIRPAEVGIADGPRRRTAGLRREEVAMLAGMSVDYVVRLEQGRSSQPSTQLLGALARALRLSDDERDHLFHLAGHQPAARRRGGPPGPRRPGAHARPARRHAGPGAVRSRARSSPRTGRPSCSRATTPASPATGATSPTAGSPTRPRGPCAPPEEQERHARQLVADLRAAAGRRSGDPAVAGLVERLQAASAEFRRLWAEHEVAVRRADRKTFVHPRVGKLVMDCETLVTPDLRPAAAGAHPGGRRDPRAAGAAARARHRGVPHR